MVRVSVLIVVSTLFLSACAVDPQQESDSLAADLLDCIPKPTVVDLWACASKKQTSSETPVFETKTVDRTAS